MVSVATGKPHTPTCDNCSDSEENADTRGTSASCTHCGSTICCNARWDDETHPFTRNLPEKVRLPDLRRVHDPRCHQRRDILYASEIVTKLDREANPGQSPRPTSSTMARFSWHHHRAFWWDPQNTTGVLENSVSVKAFPWLQKFTMNMETGMKARRYYRMAPEKVFMSFAIFGVGTEASLGYFALVKSCSKTTRTRLLM